MGNQTRIRINFDRAKMAADLLAYKTDVARVPDALRVANENLAKRLQDMAVEELKAQESTRAGRVSQRKDWLEDDLVDQRNRRPLVAGDYSRGFKVGITDFLSYGAKSKKYWRPIEYGTTDYPTVIFGFSDGPGSELVAPSMDRMGLDAKMPQFRGWPADTPARQRKPGKSPFFRGEPPHWVIVHASRFHYAPMEKAEKLFLAQADLIATEYKKQIIAKAPRLAARLNFRA